MHMLEDRPFMGIQLLILDCSPNFNFNSIKQSNIIDIGDGVFKILKGGSFHVTNASTKWGHHMFSYFFLAERGLADYPSPKYATDHRGIRGKCPVLS